jgi:hypothetical protein
MTDYTELRLDDQRLLLNKNLVKSAILPKVASDLDRDVVIQGDTIIDGAVYARHFEVQHGNLEVKGAMFTQVEMHINSDAKGSVIFRKAVGSADSVVSLTTGCRAIFGSDVSAKRISLRNAFIAGSLFADEIVLEDCVVIGGVFSSSTLEITNSIVGTFNSPRVQISKMIYLLLPSAFSTEKIYVTPGTEMYNLTLADLDSLFKGQQQSNTSGKIKMNTEADEIKSVLRSDETQQVIRSYSVIGKVLAADLQDMDKFGNHFLLTAASLGTQLLKPYDTSLENIADFFFEILIGKVDIQQISGEFNMRDLIDKIK